MAHEVHTPPLQPAASAAGTVAERRGAMDYVDASLEWLWHTLTSMRVAMVLMIILAALCVAGSLIIQAPGGLSDADKANWLEMIRPRFGGWTGVMDTVGLFNIFNGLVFRVLVAALTISLIACSVHRIPGAWRTATKPRVDVGPGFFEHAPQHETIVVHAASPEALTKVQTALKKRHYRTLSSDDGTIHLYADRFRFMAFASLAGHISLVMILLGAIIGGTFGYRNSYFAIAEGNTAPTGTETGLSLKLVNFTDTWYTSVANLPQDYASKVELYKDGAVVAAQTIRVNEPMSYNGATYYQSSYGAAVSLTVKDASGQTLFTGGVPLDRSAPDGSDRPAGFAVLPTGDMVVVTGTDGTSDTLIQPGQLRMGLYDSTGNPSGASSVADQGKAQQVGNYSVTFNREEKYTVLSITRDPGQYLVWLGALLLFGGFTLVFLLPQRRVWARIVPRGATSVVSVASLGRRDAALGTDFEDLVSDIRTALQTPTQA